MIRTLTLIILSILIWPSLLWPQDDTMNPNPGLTVSLDRNPAEVGGIVVLSIGYLVGYTSSIADSPPTGYCPWNDLDDDGDIDIFDIVGIAGRYGTSGDPHLGKAAIEYDGGWIDITDKAGECLDITHDFC